MARPGSSEFRVDLAQAGIGDGRYAFTIPLGQELLRDGENVLELRCAETQTALPGSPITVRCRIPVPAGRRDAVAAKPNGRWKADAPLPSADRSALDDEPALQSAVDAADWTRVKGWIWNPAAPEQRIELELLDGDTLLTTVVADQYRADLEQAGFGDGCYGFSIPFSDSLLPYARHVLHLRAAGSTADLPSFPIELTRQEAGFDPTLQLVLGNIKAEAARAQRADQLAPTVTALVASLDAALSRYFEITADSAAKAVGLIGPMDLTSQFSGLVNGLQGNYPPLHVDGEKEPLVSIVIPVFNKFDVTYNCVKSIVRHGAQVPFEIIFVDDCSRDETLLASFAFGRGIRLVRNPANTGFVGSCNNGFEAARGEYIAFLNNDTEVKPGWLDALYQTMRGDRQIGVAGAKLLNPDGSLQECGGIVWRLGDAWNWGRGQAADDPRFCYMRDADYVSGAALMVKASLFAELGKFDELYAPAYYEDTDLCFRVRQRGYRVVVQPAAEVVHLEGASAGTSTTGTGMKRYQAINHRKFFERWKETLARHRFNGEFPELEVERNVRQRALFIDDSVPEPDKDAGSNAAFQHMLSLQRLGYKVTFIPGDNMARIDPYTAALQRRGIECLYHPFYFSAEDIFRKQPVPVELVYLHRYSNASKYAGMVRQHLPKARILYNVADLHFLRVARQAELEDDPQLHAKAEQLKRLELGAMSFVDCVIVHSQVEAELLRQLAPDVAVQVIPWTVPLRDIGADSRKNPGPNAARKPAIAFVGGYRHPPNVDAAKWAAQSIMPALRKQVPGIELLLVGSHMPAEISRLAATDIVPLGYVPSLDGVFERVRLTIAPLRFGAGLKGKVLESMAAGIPCVMTKVAAEGIDLPAELEGLVADEPAALAEIIATLCRDDARYQRAATACRAHIAANYSPERIDGLIRGACGLE
jgi:O-antigen biosynthesis protein